MHRQTSLPDSPHDDDDLRVPDRVRGYALRRWFAPRPFASKKALFAWAPVVLLAALAVVSDVEAAQKEPPAPEPPSVAPAIASLLEGDFADPFVLRERDAYFAFATGTGRANLQVSRSADLQAWGATHEALPHLPNWAAKTGGVTWAPSVLARGNRYVLYYTTRHAASGFQCISRASAGGPEGPYVDDSAQPFVCQIGGDTPMCGSIDPSPFVDADGRLYLLWKSEENSGACRAAPRIWSQALSDDGLELLGAPRPILALDRRWEGAVIEAPSMIARNGRYHLFYSANDYDSAAYAIGYATCASPTEPCAKVTLDSPLLGSAGAMLGPGGQELFADATGPTWMAFHAWTAPRASYSSGGARSLRLARISFAGEQPKIAVMSQKEHASAP
jgi:beta-xylosidase